MSDEIENAADAAVDQYLSGITPQTQGSDPGVDDSEHAGAKTDDQMDTLLANLMAEEALTNSVDPADELPADPTEEYQYEEAELRGEEAGQGSSIQEAVQRSDEEQGLQGEAVSEGHAQEENRDEGQEEVQASQLGQQYGQALAVLTQNGWTPADVLQLDQAVAIETANALTGDDTNQPQDGEAPSASEPQALQFDMGELTQALEPELGEEATSALVKFLGEAIAPRIDARLQELESNAAWLRSQHLEQVTQGARAKLQDSYPDLADDDVYVRVKDRMRRLATTGEYESIETLLEHASRIEIPQAAKTTRVDRSRKQRGQMTPPGQAKPRGVVSKEDREDAVLNAISSPGYEGNPLAVRRQVYGR